MIANCTVPGSRAATRVYGISDVLPRALVDSDHNGFQRSRSAAAYPAPCNTTRPRCPGPNKNGMTCQLGAIVADHNAGQPAPFGKGAVREAGASG